MNIHTPRNGLHMQLRDYQTEAIAAVRADWSAGCTDTLLVAATGAGKTQMFLSLVMAELDADPAARALILAHRQELIEQPLGRVRQMDPDWLLRGVLERPRVGVIMNVQRDTDRQLTIATVQSLNAKRVAELLAHGPITHLITDECHHATAPTYVRIYEALKAANPGLKHLGVTATPLRADGDGLARVYQKDSARITIADLVHRHYLVQPRWLGIATGISLKGVKTSAGDYQASQLAERFDTERGRQIIVQAYQQYGAGRRAIAFTASVAGAHDLAAAFRDVGITAAAIDGTTDKEVRRRILDDFRAGRVQIVTNCQVLTEGFDAPGTSCILMCRPTRSDSLYVQCMGRGLRPAGGDPARPGMAMPGEDCLILDFLPAESRNIVMAGDVLGLPKETTRTVLKEQEAAEEGAVQAGFTFDGETFDANGTPMEIIGRELNYLDQSPYVWHRRDGLLTLGCGEGSDRVERILAIRGAELWGIWRRVPQDGQYPGLWQARLIPCDDPLARGAELADKHASGALVAKGRSWHTMPASEGQISYLRKLARGAIGRGELDGMTKGAAASLITHYQALQAIARTELGLQTGVVEVTRADAA